MEPRIETERDLLQLVGQPESARLEFKVSRLLLQNRGSNEKIAEVLSKEVSAFANSEGGQIIIGMRERKEGKTRVADSLDEGLPADEFGAEWLQQVVESNVSPYLLGIRVRRIRLSGEREGRWAAVIVVPGGTTAYQASDKRYYGRSEYEAKALPDHEIRLRMMKGRVAQARLDIAEAQMVTADEELAERLRTVEILRQKNSETQSRAARRRPVAERAQREAEKEAEAKANAPKRTFDQCLFKTSVTNVGEVTIRDFRLCVKFETPFEVRQGTRVISACGDPEGGIVVTEVSERFDKGVRAFGYQGSVSSRPVEAKVFPGEKVLFPAEAWEVRAPLHGELSPTKHFMRWTIYLDDAPPCSGDIDLGEALNPRSATSGQ